MSVNLQIYVQSALDFLQSCTIVFAPMATQINNNLLAQGIPVDQTAPATWRYYLNLSGQYHSADTMMTVKSLDTGQLVNFTLDMLASSPQTAAVYVAGSPSFNALCQAYPGQTDLIKSIVYPVDLQAAIAAPDFTLLGWGTGLLEDTELESILYALKSFIAYASQRWYFSFLSNEVYYVWAFWASLWQALPNAIYAARLKNLRTNAAHSFHIWSYLQSYGIGDYSDILTSQQALFLYRNLHYLKQNKGKQSTLVILVNRLLDSLNVALVGKTIYMNTATQAATCEWTPEFVSTVIPTNNAQILQLIPPASMAKMNIDLVAAGLEIDNTATYVAEQQTKLGRTPLNTLPTKVVEIQKLGVDQKYGGLLNRFILDTLVWGISTGFYTPYLTFSDPTTNISMSLSGKDALALYYYAIHRAGHEQPTILPTLYAPSCAFRPNLSVAALPTTFKYDGTVYPTRSYLPLNTLLAGVGYPVRPISIPAVFSDLIAGQFDVLIRLVRYARQDANKIALEMLQHLGDTAFFQNVTYAITLSPTPDYATWLANLQLTSLVAQLDARADLVDVYNALATTISTALLPEINSTYSGYAYTSKSTNDLYDRLRSLFVQLCSYNITFLDTERVNSWWLLYERIVFTIQNQIDTQQLSLFVLSDPKDLVQTDIIPLKGASLTGKVAITGHGLTDIRMHHADTLQTTRLDNRTVYAPLTIEVLEPSMSGVTRIPVAVGPMSKFITASS